MAASPGYEAQILNRAGDLCLRDGDDTLALRYFGRAIDAYLRAGRGRAAAALCRKVIRAAPDVVRARRTLALLAIAEGDLAEALEQVEEYVRAARSRGDVELAMLQLRVMADAAPSRPFRARVAELLSEMGDRFWAEQIGQSVPAQPASNEPIPEEPAARWSKVTQAALQGPDEVRRAAKRIAFAP